MARKFGIFISENTRDRGDDSRVEISGDRDGKDNRSGPSMAFYHRQHCPSLDPDSLLFALKSLFPSCTLRFSYFTLRNVSDLSLSLSRSPPLRRLTRLQTYCIISSKNAQYSIFTFHFHAALLCSLKLLQCICSLPLFSLFLALCALKPEEERRERENVCPKSRFERKQRAHRRERIVRAR